MAGIGALLLVLTRPFDSKTVQRAGVRLVGTMRRGGSQRDHDDHLESVGTR